MAKPIFIVGPWHSGTYLMQKILSGHSDGFCIQGESHFFLRKNRIASKLRGLKEKARWRAFFDDVLVHPNAANAFEGHERVLEILVREHPFSDDASPDRQFALLMAAITTELGKAFWIEKSPSHIAYLEEIMCAFPSAHVVVTIRDPRAVMASTKIRSRKPGGNDVKEIYNPVHEIFTWKEVARNYERLRARLPDQVSLVRYEDLVTDGNRVVEQLCKRLGIEFQEPMLEVRQVNAAYKDEQGRSGFDTRPLNRWQDELRREELFLIKTFCSVESRRLGYEVPADAMDLAGAGRLVAVTLRFLLAKLANARQSLGHVPTSVLLDRLRRKYFG